MSGIIVALLGVKVSTPGLATPIAGFAVSVAENGMTGLMAVSYTHLISCIYNFLFFFYFYLVFIFPCPWRK